MKINKLVLMTLLISFTAFSTSFASNDRNLLLVVEQSDGAVSFYDEISGDRLNTVRVGLNPHEITVSKDGKTAYVTNFGVQDYDHTIGEPGLLSLIHI